MHLSHTWGVVENLRLYMKIIFHFRNEKHSGVSRISRSFVGPILGTCRQAGHHFVPSNGPTSDCEVRLAPYCFPFLKWPIDSVAFIMFNTVQASNGLVKPGRELEHYPHHDSVPSVSHDKCSVVKTEFAGRPCILKVICNHESIE